jgi:hypothetical protein
MKKFLFAATVSLSLVSISLKSQNSDAEDSDSKWRFGLRGNIQPTWFSSSDKNNIPNGAGLGAGFGLNIEYKISKVAALLGGIGADFETGKYKFRNDNGYEVRYWRDESKVEFVQPGTKSENAITTLKNPSNTGYILKSRVVKTTFITIPIILKLSTKEYSGFKYFGMFGAELGIRIKSRANDSYYDSFSYDSLGKATSTGVLSQDKINIGGFGNKIDANRVPIRLGLNVGLGTEYRLGGTTSLLVSVNYFRSFWNYMRNDSPNMIYKTTPVNTGTEKYSFVTQNLILSAVRINVGIMF